MLATIAAVSPVSSLPSPTLPPAPLPSRSWRLAASHGHELHVDEWGEPASPPALVLHGGPGSGCSPALVRGFDLRRWRVIGVDQRGAGRSTPAGDLRHNTTPLLLADLRALRRALGIDRWLVVGGSWGATLALLHALDAPDAVAGLLLRGVFTAARDDVDAFFERAVREGPPIWAQWQRAASARGRRLVEHLAHLLTVSLPDNQRELAQHWWQWERSLQGDDPATSPTPAPDPAALLQRYRVQAHYLAHDCWIGEAPLSARLQALPGVPTLLLHGTRDRVCPPDGARDVHARLPHATLRWVEGAGHSPLHPAMAAAMAAALGTFADRGTFTSGPAR